MIFDSNRAWQEATAAASASRSVLLPIAGVFFLIPAVAQSFFLGDIQAQMMASLGKQEALNAIMQAEGGKIIGITLAALIIQIIGYLAVLTMLTDRNRPTVGEAIAGGIKALPTTIGAVIVGYLVMILVAMVLAIIGGVLTMLIGAAGAFVLIVGIFAVMAILGVKLSLTMPVIVVENQMNPITALTRSWRLTRGNSLRLFGFYALMFIGYLVIALILMGLIGAVAGVLGGATSKGALLLTGVVGGAIGAVVGVLFCAVLAAIHRQLSGTGDAAIGDTFA